MNKKFFLLLIGLVLTGCGTLGERPSIFENPNCKPPCWENITPGITTKDEALATLSKIDIVKQPIFDLRDTARGFSSELRFSLYDEKSSLSGSVLMMDDLVVLIDFGTKLDLTLEEAIERFGAPQSILAFHSNLMWVTLVDPQKGIAFGYSSAGQPDWVYSEIRPEVEIGEVMFFDPEHYQQILDSGILSYYLLSSEETKSRLRPWNGYGNLSKYEK
jgi:hypothetical protein